MKKAKATTRRTFLKQAGLASSLMVLPPHVLGQEGQGAPSDKLNLAFIGVGGRGGRNVRAMENENFIAFADVDDERAKKTFQQFEKVQKYRDYRKMLDTHENEIDAVVVSTPDHTHAVAAMDAIQRGKHVYVEKPLAHSIFETRELLKASRKHNVQTQLGNQGHSSGNIRDVCEWVRDGALGEVNEVHVWYRNSYGDVDGYPSDTPSIPDTLSWDLWLGPAKERPYHSAYLPGSWRGWRPFGTGVMGDWVCHILDPAFWALQLDAPASVIAHNAGKPFAPERFPQQSVIEYRFPARNSRPPVKVTWTYGTSPHIPQLEDIQLDSWNQKAGAILIGEKGCIVHGSHGAGGAKLLPRSLDESYKRPPKIISRVKGGHQGDWVRACKDGKPASSHFEYGAPLTEVALLGVIAGYYGGEKLEWDSQKMQFKNHGKASEMVKPVFREGWSL
ncbi:gfo/Idh/MocA family oxidoreductase [bacterium]|nr:gfo/Idh/MocA family oxidoreductase [bacterium]